MAAGRLRTRITITQRGTAQDALGQPVATWSTVATVWADIRHPSGVQAVKGDADMSIVKASIRIRRRSDVDAGMRVTAGADVYDIKAVLPDADRKYLNLPSEKVA
jgi:SPP1 family predicted phage head-tail adaptor